MKLLAIGLPTLTKGQYAIGINLLSSRAHVICGIYVSGYLCKDYTFH